MAIISTAFESASPPVLAAQQEMHRMMKYHRKDSEDWDVPKLLAAISLYKDKYYAARRELRKANKSLEFYATAYRLQQVFNIQHAEEIWALKKEVDRLQQVIKTRATSFCPDDVPGV